MVSFSIAFSYVFCIEVFFMSLYSTVQYSTIQYSTIQYNTVVQYSGTSWSSRARTSSGASCRASTLVAQPLASFLMDDDALWWISD